MTAGSTTIRWEHGEDGVVVLTLDDPSQSANTMNDAYLASMGATLDRLEAERDAIAGVIVTSAKKTFFAGGDLNDLLAVTPAELERFSGWLREAKGQLRRLETLGRPVVAAINGTAFGGGLEIALATHHRVVVDDPRLRIGLPEVTLGLLPGGGGVVRTVRMLGVEAALVHVLLPGTAHRPADALRLGLINELVDSQEQLLPAARAWIAGPGAAACAAVQPCDAPGCTAGAAACAAVQPWDAPGYVLPGGTAWAPPVGWAVDGLPEALRLQLLGGRFPAPRAIVAAAVEGAAAADFDAASEIEGRHFVDLVVGDTAKRMIQAFFFDRQRLASQARAKGHDPEAAAARRRALGERLTQALRAEAATLRLAGVPAAAIERAAALAGFTGPALTALGDGGSAGAEPAALPADTALTALGDGGSAGAELAALAPETELSREQIEARLLRRLADEAAAALQDGAAATAEEANAASIDGAGYPGWTGGALRYREQMQSARTAPYAR
ncbi:MAG TPA: enoyl-CoA hydratase/isomerase family protein [Conexibacter sp.]